MDKLGQHVEDMQGGDEDRATSAASAVKELSMEAENRHRLFQEDGLVGGLTAVIEKACPATADAVVAIHNISDVRSEGGVTEKALYDFEGGRLFRAIRKVIQGETSSDMVAEKEGEEYKVPRENALLAMGTITLGGHEVQKGMFEYEGLMSCLVKVAEKEGEEYKVAREMALGAMQNIAIGGPEVKKGMFEYEGLMSCLVKVAEKEGEEYKVARENALGAMQNIAIGGPEVKKGMFEYEGLMSCLMKVLEKEGEEYKTLFNFVTNKGAGDAGGGSADVESAALAVEALLELSYPSPSSASSSTTAALDILTKKVDSSLESLPDLLKIYASTPSVLSSSFSDSASTAIAIIDRISLLKNKTSTAKAVSILKAAAKRKSIVTSTKDDEATVAVTKNAKNELMKTKEALERQIANAEEQERKLQQRLANAEKNSNDKIAALERKLAEAEAAKLKYRNDDMQAQMSEMMAAMSETRALVKGLDTKTDVIMSSVNTTLSSLQNFYTGVSEVPRYILVVPFAKKTESTTGKLSRFFSAPKEFFLSEPTAKLVILCSHDFSAVVDFEIKEPKQFVKDHAATIQMTL
ncbi:hypothetical protein TrRE_jg1765, partial [Triparma retinervis]